MDDTMKMPDTTKAEHLARPAIEKKDLTETVTYTTHAAFNDFVLRLKQLQVSHPDWTDPRNQNRPFKQSFLEFLRKLILRLPVAPEMTPMVNGTVRLRYKKKAPRDKWQTLEFTIYPQRYFEMSAKSRMPKQDPFQRTNVARPDYISDMIQAFYAYDYVNTKEHPLRFRKAVVTDYPFISAMCQMTFGPHICYHPTNISKLCQYCYVADDPMYGVVSVAAVSPSSHGTDFEVNFMVTTQNYRGLSIASKCLRKCVIDVLKEHPNAVINAAAPMAYDSAKDVAHSALRRAGFKKTKVVKGEKRYKCFDCDRCNTLNRYCDFDDPTSVCSTAYYTLVDSGFKGKK